MSFAEYRTRKKFDKPPKDYLFSSIDETGALLIKPTWFNILVKLSKVWENEGLSNFVKNRIDAGNYTLPLPKKMYDFVYKRELPMHIRYSILGIIKRYSSQKERTMLLRLRNQKFLNQHYKHVLFDIHEKFGTTSADIYMRMFEEGFGYEFNILSSNLKVNKPFDESIKFLHDGLAKMHRLDRGLSRARKSLNLFVHLSVYLFLISYFTSVFIAYIWIDVEYKSIPWYFSSGKSLIQFCMSNPVAGISIVSLFIIVIEVLFDVFKLSDVALSMMPRIVEMDRFINSFKFFTTMKSMSDTGDSSDSMFLFASVASMDLVHIRNMLNEKIDKIIQTSNNRFVDFLLTTSYFREQDLVVLLNTSNRNLDRKDLDENLEALLNLYDIEIGEREESDVEAIKFYASVIVNILLMSTMLITTLSELQTVQIQF